MAMTMTPQEQAWQSGLVLLDQDPQWNTSNWPPLLGGCRVQHASVVLNHIDPDNNNNHGDDDKTQTVVVMGGFQRNERVTNSVLLLNLHDMQWREGPPMNQSRRGHVAVLCNGSVYVLGGRNWRYFNCIERMDASDLLLQSSSSTTRSSSTHERHWTTLNCGLATARMGCCAVAVHDRYIVVAGGWKREQQQDSLLSFSSVEILDTSNHTVMEGPSMAFPRTMCFGAVMGHRIYVVGGATHVEYWDLANPGEKAKTTEETSCPTFISPSSSWTTHSDLRLSIPLAVPSGAVAVGSSIVVADANGNVEVLDTHRDRVSSLPSFQRPRDGFNLVALATTNQIAVIGGDEDGDDACGTLGLMDKNSWCFRRLCEQPMGWSRQLVAKLCEQPMGWSRQLVAMQKAIQSVLRNGTPGDPSTPARKKARTITS